MRTIELGEYSSRFVAKEEFDCELGNILYDRYKGKVDVEFPSPKTDGKWKLTSLGWVGYIRLSEDTGISLVPKVRLDNIFGMLEYAYDLKSFDFADDVYSCESLEDFYDNLVVRFSKLVLKRLKRGLYGDYLPYTENLPYVRGRMDTDALFRKPWEIKPVCSYQEHTGDVDENRILAWTLKKITTSGLCSDDTLAIVRKAYRNLQRIVNVVPFKTEDCSKRLYNRLNEDYKPMHFLCAFFLENSGPTHKTGDRKTQAFTVNMGRLYELFVFRWLEKNLPQRFAIRAQERLEPDGEGAPKFNIDLVVYDSKTQKPLAVMDTKYKTPSHVSNKDFNQITVYALGKGCAKAFIVYPVELNMDTNLRDIRIKTIPFTLGGNLDENGKRFVEKMSVELETASLRSNS